MRHVPLRPSQTMPTKTLWCRQIVTRYISTNAITNRSTTVCISRLTQLTLFELLTLWSSFIGRLHGAIVGPSAVEPTIAPCKRPVSRYVSINAVRHPLHFRNSATFAEAGLSATAGLLVIVVTYTELTWWAAIRGTIAKSCWRDNAVRQTLFT